MRESPQKGDSFTILCPLKLLVEWSSETNAFGQEPLIQGTIGERQNGSNGCWTSFDGSRIAADRRIRGIDVARIRAGQAQGIDGPKDPTEQSQLGQIL